MRISLSAIRQKEDDGRAGALGPRARERLGVAPLDEGGERKELGGGDHTLAAPSVDAHGEHDLSSVPARAGGRIRCGHALPEP